METVDTFTAKIYIGFKEIPTDIIHTIDEVYAICQKYVDSVGLCVTVTSTKYIYTKGNEDGVEIGLINYPRFPDTPDNIRSKAINLARILKKEFNQFRVSVVFIDKTIMLEGDE